MAIGVGTPSIFTTRAYVDSFPKKRAKKMRGDASPRSARSSDLDSNADLVAVSMKLPMFYKYMQHIGNNMTFFVSAMPAIQLNLTPAQLADLKTTFSELENDNVGWWQSTVYS
jgi:hypothetical protein